MKKTLCIFLATLLLCMGIGMSASAAAETPQQAPPKSAATDALWAVLNNFDFTNLTNAQITILVNTLKALKALGVDYSGFLERISPLLPFSAKAALHDAGLASYPIWERDLMYYLIFKYLLFGWLWM